MSFLLDTVTVSATRGPRRVLMVDQWVAAQPNERLFLSVLTIGEILRGAERARASDSTFATALESWAASLELRFGRRILPVDIDVARLWGRLTARIGHAGADMMIAATALVHDMTVVTRNVRHFAPAGVRTFDPWAQ